MEVNIISLKFFDYYNVILKEKYFLRFNCNFDGWRENCNKFCIGM